MTRSTLLNMAIMTRVITGREGTSCAVSASTQMLGGDKDIDFVQKGLEAQGFRVSRVTQEDGNTYLVSSEADRDEPTEDEIIAAIEYYKPLTAKFIKPS